MLVDNFGTRITENDVNYIKGNVTNVVIGSGVTDISVGTFSKCTALTSVNIPNSVTYIGDNAFKDCTNLEDVPFERGPADSDGYNHVSIGLLAFDGCSKAKIAYSGNVKSALYIRTENFNYSMVAAGTELASINDKTVYWMSAYPSVTQAPTAKTGLIYNGDSQQLVSGGTASEGAEMRYAVYKGKIVRSPDSELKMTTLIADELETGTIYTFAEKENSGFNFPYGYKVRFYGTELDYTPDDDDSVVAWFRGDVPVIGVYKTGAEGPTIVPLNGDAFKIISVDNNEKRIIIDNVDTKELTNMGGISWSSTAAAQDAGVYTVLYKSVDNSLSDSDIGFVAARIAKADLSADNITAPTAANPYYTGGEVALVTAGTSPEGTVVPVNSRIPQVTIDNDIDVTDVMVGDVFAPTDVQGIYLSDYSKFKLDDDQTVRSIGGYRGVNVYKGVNSNPKYYVGGDGTYYSLKNGCNAVKVKEIIEENNEKIIVLESLKYTEDYDLYAEWSAAVPKATEVGAYKVYYYVDSGDNYKDTAPAFVTSTISYKTANVTAEAKSNIVYDGKEVDASDFNFTGDDAETLLADENTTITVGNFVNEKGERGDGKSAGTYTCDITIQSANYNDLCLEGVGVTINKKDLIVTPDADQSITFGDKKIGEYNKSIDAPKFTISGFVEGDEIEFFDVLDVDYDDNNDLTVNVSGDRYVNAGTYNFILENVTADNYNLVLDPDAPTFTVERKSLGSKHMGENDVKVTLESAVANDPIKTNGGYHFDYNGGIRTVKIVSIVDEAIGVTLCDEVDYKAAYTSKQNIGEYAVHMIGLGNYKDYLLEPWSIIAAKISDDNIIYGDNYVNGIKFYDGKSIEDSITLKNISDGAEVTTKYYNAEYDNGKWVKTGDPLSKIPKDAGDYIVEISISGYGYDDTESFEKHIGIAKQIATVKAKFDKSNISWLDPAPSVIGNEFEGFVDGDLEEIYANDPDLVTWTHNAAEKCFVGAVKPEFVEYYSKNYVINVEDTEYGLDPRYIYADGIEVEYNAKTLLPDNDFATCNIVIIDHEDNDRVLIQGRDYIINGGTVAAPGKYVVEIIGTNRNVHGYTGIREIEWEVVRESEAIAEAESVTTVDVQYIETYIATNGKTRVKFNADTTVDSNKFTVKETGAIYFNEATGTPTAELTYENAVKAVCSIKKAGNAGDHLNIGLLDNGNGFYARFYSIVTDGVNDYVVYASDEAKYYNYEQLSAESATTVDAQFIETYVATNGKTRVRFTADTTINSDKYTVKETGAIYFNEATGTPTAELTFENAENAVGKIKKAGNAGDHLNIGLLDNGNGFFARFYSIVTDGVNDYVVYASDEAKYYNYEQLTAELATTIDVQFVETYVATNGKTRVRFTADTTVNSDKYTIKETGAIYFNEATGIPTAELTFENAENAVGKIKKAGNAGDPLNIGLLDNGNGFFANFYSIVTDGTNDYVVYAFDEAEHYSYAELSVQ